MKVAKSDTQQKFTTEVTCKVMQSSVFVFYFRQKNNKGWRKRWFVFDGKDLRYYKDKVSFVHQKNCPKR